MIISQTPLRVSFAGGGTDFARYYREHEGAVVSSAIDKYVYVVVVPRFDELIIVNYTKKETVENVRDLKHELVREALLRTGVDNGVEITTLADVPSEGSGLGSSSTVTVGLLHALYAYKGRLVTAEQLAREACEIEIDICGKPIGKQDQYIAAYGGVCEFRFCKDDSVDVRQFRRSMELFHGLSRNIMLFYTGRTRKAGNILSVQDSRTEANLEQLHCLKALALRTAEALDRLRLWEVGRVLNDGWQLKRQLAEGISNPEIEEMYDLALSAGASGGKICGAGGGGFLLLYCDPAHHKAVRKAMEAYRELPIALDPDGSKIIFQQRTGYRMASV
jgi:D-glycero-alpha-D-manno-heptose-7-phosphate kinase